MRMHSQDSFGHKQLEQLAEAFRLANKLAEGEDKLSRHDAKTKEQIGRKFAEAVAWSQLCLADARESGQPPYVMEMYSKFRRIFNEYSVVALTMSGKFKSMPELFSFCDQNPQARFESSACSRKPGRFAATGVTTRKSLGLPTDWWLPRHPSQRR